MSKLTNKQLQEAKNNYYAVYTFGDDGRRSGVIGGCNILRTIEEAQNGLTLVYPNELDNARVPLAVFDGLDLKESSKEHTVWMWVLELEAAKKRRATWREVQSIHFKAEMWLAQQGGQKNEG